MGKVLMWVAAACGLLVLVAVVFAPQNTPERIEAACRKQYGYDDPAVAQCQLALSLKAIDDGQRARMRAAARDAGL